MATVQALPATGTPPCPPCLYEFVELANCVRRGADCDEPFRVFVDCLRRHGLRTGNTTDSAHIATPPWAGPWHS